MNIWIPAIVGTLVSLAALAVGALSWSRRNPRARLAPGQPPGGWPPPVAAGVPSKDGSVTPDGCLVMVVDGSADPAGTVADLVGHIRSLSRVTPALRRRRLEVPFIPASSWEEDPDFDVGLHIHVMALPPPGSSHELEDLIGRIAETPLDRTRPLWDLYAIRGLVDGRAAVVLKTDPALVDTVGGIEEIIDVKTDPETGEKCLAAKILEQFYYYRATSNHQQDAFLDVWATSHSAREPHSPRET
ncbi:wax ester/triacylglycerol synthase domain-containing protein [Mycobacterium sp. SMC-14]|uniref:wax ester/triacylglycerol synthase domain-containing protein n=1 Tax=Mycobacterium sp. SMC-14 TaxID=3385968 RepID=UPI00390CBA85